MPVRMIQEFAKQVEMLYVVEELDPVIETHCRVNGIRVDGGKNLFGLLGERCVSLSRQCSASAPHGYRCAV